MSARELADAVRKYLTRHPSAEVALGILESDALRAESLRNRVDALSEWLEECAWSWDLGYVCYFCGYRGDERKHTDDCRLNAAHDHNDAE